MRTNGFLQILRFPVVVGNVLQVLGPWATTKGGGKTYYTNWGLRGSVL